MQESRDSLRKAALAHRRGLAQADCVSWSRSIQARAIDMPQFRAAPTVALYSPIQNEVATETILAEALASGKSVYLPKLSGPDPAGFAAIENESNLISARGGILEPTIDHYISLAECEQVIIFTPGVLFDRRGNRLGRGGGWYDRMLAAIAIRGSGVFVGLAYDCQIVDHLPTENWDQRVHFIVSQSDLIDCDLTLL